MYLYEVKYFEVSVHLLMIANIISFLRGNTGGYGEFYFTNADYPRVVFKNTISWVKYVEMHLFYVIL